MTKTIKAKVTPIQSKSLKVCLCPNPIPIEYTFGKIVRVPGTTGDVIDYNSVMQNSHRMRVVKLWCPICKKEFKPEIR